MDGADFIKKALSATRESKSIEFKSGFGPGLPGEWCEIIKDVVALANSGGGIIIFGLDSEGKPSGESVEVIAKEDSANISNKLVKYIGPPSFEIEGVELAKDGFRLYALIISGASIPHIFQKPGTYEVTPGQQKTAFGVGTIYFRHGAKSEFGNNNDLRIVLDRELKIVRKALMKGVRRVVQAPVDTEIVVVPKGTRAPGTIANVVRAVKDPSANPIFLTRGSEKTVGVFYHEEVSEGIFNEINNVIDANKALARGQKRFFLGQAIYHRIYAERQYARSQRDNFESLLRAAVAEFYAPGLFWMLSLPDEVIAAAYAELYKSPRHPQIQSLVRIAPILGEDFSQWLLGKLKNKWGKHTQPPTFYWTFKDAVEKEGAVDYRLRAARLSANAAPRLQAQETVNVTELLGDPSRASALVSAACMVTFEGRDNGESRSIARNLDYLAYGAEIRKRAPGISNAIVRAVGNRQVGELTDSSDP